MMTKTRILDEEKKEHQQTKKKDTVLRKREANARKGKEREN